VQVDNHICHQSEKHYSLKISKRWRPLPKAGLSAVGKMFFVHSRDPELAID
jgi:hypothetical protein